MAIGHVEIDYNSRILTADKVMDDQNADVVTADGHVTIMAPNGDVVFAKHAVLTDEMKDGVLEAFSALIGQNGRLAAVRANRDAQRRRAHGCGTRAIYTPCKVCKQTGTTHAGMGRSSPRAFIYDEVNHRIYYRDAVDPDAFGMPVFYTPLFLATRSDREARLRHPACRDIGTFEHARHISRMPLYIAFSELAGHDDRALLSPRNAAKSSKANTASGGTTAACGCRRVSPITSLWRDSAAMPRPDLQFAVRRRHYSRSPTSGISAIDAQLTSNETYLELYKIFAGTTG